MRIATVILCTAALVFASGCAMQRKKTLESASPANPVDCRTAEADIRVLESEKAHVAEQIAMGVTAIVAALGRGDLAHRGEESATYQK